MTIEITDKQPHSKGMLYSIKIADRIVIILFLFHAIDRIKKWGITEDMVAEALILPEEVIIGHRNRYIAHRRYGNHMVRAVYTYKEDMPVLITVYYPYLERYFKGGGTYENKIFR